MGQNGKVIEGREYTFGLCQIRVDDYVNVAHRWRQRFVENIIGPISENQLLARRAKYSEVMEFDKKIREFPDPPIQPSSDELKARLWGMNKGVGKAYLHLDLIV